jgi:hypothetical protein
VKRGFASTTGWFKAPLLVAGPMLGSWIVLLAGGSMFFGGPVGGIIGLVVLIVDILLIVSIWRSHKALIPKVVWTLVIIFLSVIGWILYFFLGRER